MTGTFHAARARHLTLGKLGERDAVKLLEWHQHEILARNFRTRRGELDIVARDGAAIVFVEVKTRSRTDEYAPADNLSPRQLRRNVRAAERYLQDYAAPGFPCRFDLIEVIRTRWRLKSIRRHRDFIDPTLIGRKF